MKIQNETLLVKKKYLYSAICIISFLILSWVTPPFSYLWDLIDKNLFIFLNKSALYFPSLQVGIAWLNSRYGDWFYEFLFLAIYLVSIAFHKDKKRKIYQLSFLILLVFFVQVCINTVICRKILDLSRYSPSKMLNVFVDFSNFKFPHNRIFTTHSFPSDRATTLFLCAIFSWSHFRYPIALIFTFVSLIFALSRLIVGAHWLSDIIMGGFVLSYAIWIICMYVPFLKQFSKKTTKFTQIN